MKVNGKEYSTVWMENNSVYFINQLALPHKFMIYKSRDHNKTAEAIKDMVVRGAPAIAAAAAFGMAQAVLSCDKEENLEEIVNTAEALLKNTRPTAVELSNAVDYVKKRVLEHKNDILTAKIIAVISANRYADLSVEKCKRIGEIGEKLIKDGMKILTHCNAGALACVDYGTALAPIRLAHYNKKKLFVFVDETRPRNQGSLTAWELGEEGIDHAIIADNAAGYFMKKGKIDIVIVGADRICARDGSFANKIGTYEKAVLAKENNIPFYVAAPLVTIDRNAERGDDIPIEERPEEEVTHIYACNDGSGKIIRVTPEKSRALNPAFDVTPAKYVTGIITEVGILKPDRESLEEALKKIEA